MSTWTKIGCWRHRAALEDRAGSNGLRPEENSQLDAHLHECAECRQSLDDALLATALLRQDYDAAPTGSEEISDEYSPNYSGEQAVAPNPFSMRVMSSIREEISRRSTPELIWRPVELLASRFAVAAAAVLLMLSIYMAEFAPPLRPAPVATQAESAQVGQTQIEAGPNEVGAFMPEPPAQPATPDEVLMSLAGEGQ